MEKEKKLKRISSSMSLERNQLQDWLRRSLREFANYEVSKRTKKLKKPA